MERECLQCGSTFVWAPGPGRHGRPPVTCSPECKEERRKEWYRARYAKALAATQRRRQRGSPYLAVPCDVDGCERMAYAKNLCCMHYSRLRQTGEVGEAAPRRSHSGDLVWRWQDPRNGYVQLTLPGDRSKRILEHRYVMEQMLGRPLLPDENVHHKNGVRDDNRPENLELWVKPQPAGQRVEDLVSWVLDNYPAEVANAIEQRGSPTGGWFAYAKRGKNFAE